MRLLIPMAGAGSRFSDAGYKLSKPLIPITDRVTGESLPMVVAASNDLVAGQSISTPVFVDRDFHRDSGVQQEILEHLPKATFITLSALTDGQASTCLMAKTLINDDESLLIGACDNGVSYSVDRFQTLTETSDALIFTYRNNESVLEKPEAYGWVVVGGDGLTVERVSVKKPVSSNPLCDHAVVASFWFKHGRDFVAATERMINQDDRVNGEFYADQVMQHAVDMGLTVKVMEVDRYFGWGTPKDYQDYEQTIKYWTEFVEEEDWL